MDQERGIPKIDLVLHQLNKAIYMLVKNGN
jgi:hypothetical protein